MKTVSKFLLIPLIAAIIACFLFFLVALIPQSTIQQNAAQSARELVSQPQWMTVLNSGDPSYTMDNYTDSQIILQSYNLTISNLESILSNPKHISEIDNTNMALALDEVVNQGAENETNYVVIGWDSECSFALFCSLDHIMIFAKLLQLHFLCYFLQH